LDALGPPFGEPIIRRTPEATRRADGIIEGTVIAIDRFGTAVTNLMARRGGVIMVDGRTLPLSRSYSDVGGGELVALVGSSGLVEIAQRDGSAAAHLRLTRGSGVLLLPS
ncbi:MAG TPA: SAM hydroxide adenosyltransferase, partial [Gemmatimonadaceae bacterium]|nr:SAM hydroxide adenosyltransferase [Gemmatimonadaceae bacterium]